MAKRDAVKLFAVASVAISSIVGMTNVCLGSPNSLLSPTFAIASTQETGGFAVDKGVHHSRGKANPIALPPMGWSSWNSFSNTVDAQIIMEQARAMISNGMAKAGYQYVNIDEGWWLGARDSKGNIVVDANAWPALTSGERAGDMANIARYLHGLGLKAGIYTDAGKDGCSFYGPDLGPRTPHTGSEGHYDQDFLQFARWGFDYVKVDWCGGSNENLDPAVQYKEIARAIVRAEHLTGHKLFFSLCEWGGNSPWTRAPGLGGVHTDIWRTSGDIVAPIVAGSPNSARRASFAGVLSNFDQGIHPGGQHTGFYNDPDMMVVGMPGLSEAQNRVHMGLWAISGAPLIVGADLTKLQNSTRATLTNPDVIAVDQDELGIQAIKVAEPWPGLQVWTKPLAAPGTHAVLLLNRTLETKTIHVTWKEIGLDPSSAATVKDLWNGNQIGKYQSSYETCVPPGDATLLMIRGVDAVPVTYVPNSSASESDKAVTVGLKAAHQGDGRAPINGNRIVTFKILPSDKVRVIQLFYINRKKGPVLEALKVDDQVPTSVLLPPTGTSGQLSSVTIEIKSEKREPGNILRFISPCDTAVRLVSVSVLPIG